MSKQEMVMRRVGGALRPDGDQSWDVFDTIPANKSVLVTVHRSRNPDHLRRYWALCAVVADHYEGFDDREDADHWVRMKIPWMHKEYRVGDDNRVIIRPVSIALQSMDQQRFSQFYARAEELFSQLLGCDVRALAEAVWAAAKNKRAPAS